MCADSFARNPLAGWILSPRALKNLGDGVLREPVDLQVRVKLSKLVCNGYVTLGVAESDR